AGAEERPKLFRLAWDLTQSSCGARQNLYEKPFCGDPIRMHSALYEVYDKKPHVQRIREFIHQTSPDHTNPDQTKTVAA
ncbi:4-hydroxyphenylacetate 3-hydroxylase C-terminal domain-containing protein, partial [Deinococcus sp. GbtcB9]|uniref:4-hydroxyphenylacetate 3-hydroxylase C-terminal domain-containing protein n=1 Tax=Deinococcus sp. GbtcB9 TaxID=2824754 RepID=UPI00273A0D95